MTAAPFFQWGNPMLIISRKEHQSLVIGDNITVTVIQILDDKVRLGIELPKEIPVHRKEVFEAIRGAASSQLRKEPTPQFGHAIIFVSDMARSIAFYRDVLGLRWSDSESPKWIEFDTPGEHAGPAPCRPSRPNHFIGRRDSSRRLSSELRRGRPRRLPSGNGRQSRRLPTTTGGTRSGVAGLAGYADPDGLPFWVNDKAKKS